MATITLQFRHSRHFEFIEFIDVTKFSVKDSPVVTARVAREDHLLNGIAFENLVDDIFGSIGDTFAEGCH